MLQEASEMVNPKLNKFERKLEDHNQKIQTIVEFQNEKIGKPDFYQIIGFYRIF